MFTSDIPPRVRTAWTLTIGVRTAWILCYPVFIWSFTFMLTIGVFANEEVLMLLFILSVVYAIYSSRCCAFRIQFYFFLKVFKHDDLVISGYSLELIGLVLDLFFSILNISFVGHKWSQLQSKYCRSMQEFDKTVYVKSSLLYLCCRFQNWVWFQ